MRGKFAATKVTCVLKKKNKKKQKTENRKLKAAWPRGGKLNH